MPFGDPTLTVSHRMLIDPLQYQRRAVAQTLSTENLRPRILIADAVGLGKTPEIGMTIAELARRGRAERVLVVTPRHVLEQMQHELWRAAGLFPWTLTKAFLSSSAALHATVTERMNRIKDHKSPESKREHEALARLKELAANGMTADASPAGDKGKLATLVNYLKNIGIGRDSDTRVVLFAERVPR